MLMCLQILIPFGMLRLKFTPTFSHPSLSLRQLLCALRSPARRAQDAMLQLQSKFTPTPLLIYASHSSSKSPSFAMLIQGGVLCSPLVVYVWCYTPPTANAYTTRSCYARLPAPFGHIILSCGVQFNGNRGGENLTAQYRYAQCGITAI